METLISVFTMLIDFCHTVAKFFSDLVKPLSNIETVAAIIVLAVIVAGIGANGPWKRRRKSGEHPWD
jgi:hypothetical protein